MPFPSQDPKSICGIGTRIGDLNRIVGHPTNVAPDTGFETQSNVTYIEPESEAGTDREAENTEPRSGTRSRTTTKSKPVQHQTKMDANPETNNRVNGSYDAQANDNAGASATANTKRDSVNGAQYIHVYINAPNATSVSVTKTKK